MSFGYDPDLPAGFQDADFDQRELEAQGQEHYARYRRAREAFEAGDLAKAAKICPHGWCGPVAKSHADPCEGFQCYHCGSRMRSADWYMHGGCPVEEPCVFPDKIWEEG